MKYCIKCGSELRGAKNYCIVCGAQQDRAKAEGKTIEKPVRPKSDARKSSKSSDCVKCGEETEKQCFFCNDFICRDHSIRMQANVLPVFDMSQLKTQQETKRINEGWRGFIVFSCSSCAGKRAGKHLTEDENRMISTLDHCTWYKLDA